MKFLTIDLEGCARCHDSGHPKLVFTELTHPQRILFDGGDVVAPFTHWAPCPTNGQPIMLAIVPTPEPSAQTEV